MRHLTRTAMAMLIACLGFGAAAFGQDRLVDLASARSIENRAVTAPADAPAEVFLADASELLLSPGSSLRIDRYTYDPATGRGILNVTVLNGTVRIAGGTLNDQTDVLISAGGADLRLDQGAAVVEVSPLGVRTYLSYGRSLKVSSAGVTQDIMRPEFQVRVPSAGPPSSLEPMSGDQLAADFQAFAAQQNVTRIVGPAEGTQLASVDNSDLIVRSPAGATTPSRPNTTENFQGFGDGLSGTSSGAAPPVNAPAAAPSIPGGGSSGTSSIQNELDGIVSNSWVQRRQDQEFDDQSGAIFLPEVTYASRDQIESSFLLEANEQTRDAGPTTNKLFGNSGLTFAAAEAGFVPPISANADMGGLIHFWGTDRFISSENFLFGFNGITRLNFVVELPEPLDPLTPLPSDPTRELEAPFIFNLASSPVDPVVSSQGFYIAASTTTDIIDGVPTRVVEPASFDDRTRAEGLNFGALFISERSLDNFLYLELIERDSSDRLIFASGDIDQAGSPRNFTPLTLDRFFVSAGLTDAQRALADGGAIPGNGSDLAAGQRAFLRAESWTALDQSASLDELTDTGFFVISPAARMAVPQVFPATVWTAQAIHADIGIAGDPDAQRSSISATIGTVDYRDNNELGDVDALTTVFTIGSSRAGSSASTTFYGPVLSTAAGGGNPRLDADGDGEQDPGRMGFLVLENAGFVFDDVIDGSGNQPSRSLEGGIERPVGGTQTQRFALARLAQGTSARSLTDRAEPVAHAGYAAGFVEQPGEDGIGISLFGAFDAEPNLTRLAPDPDSNTFSATLSRGAGGESFQLGGPDGSAYADSQLFGALSSSIEDARLALISGDMLTRPAASQGTFTLGDLEISFADPQATDPGYRHLEWGFFFGDLATAAEAGHVHLGSFATGAPVSTDDLAGSRGEATYRGHAIGNVINGGTRYTATGTYSETFVFGGGTGSGQTELDFDRTAYQGVSDLTDGRYSSAVANTANTREGRLTGSFVGPLDGPGATPAGVVGRFQLQNTAGEGEAVYRATGTFGGEQN